MTRQKMHDNEFPTDEQLVRSLLDAQFPDWAELPIVAVDSAGTDNALFRLGEDMVVRLPRIPGAVEQVAKEQRWLPVLAPHLPLAVSAPIGAGVPGSGYPWPWSINRWIPGETGTIGRFTDPIEAARAVRGIGEERAFRSRSDSPWSRARRLPGERPSPGPRPR